MGPWIERPDSPAEPSLVAYAIREGFADQHGAGRFGRGLFA